MGLKQGALLGTHWEPREHIENLMVIHWELEGNMLRTKKIKIKINALWVHADEPSHWVLGSCVFFGVHCIEETWTIILTIGQHCQFLIFGFEMNAQENGEEDPCMKLFFWRRWRVGKWLCHFEKLQTTIGIWATPFSYIRLISHFCIFQIKNHQLVKIHFAIFW
jgi:hypothetical protein